MKIIVNNKPISITEKDFITSGGEGKIYSKNNIIFKIYHDKSKMIPLNKIKELSILTNKFIIKPEEIIYDDCKTLIGYTMQNVPNAFSLCETFTKTFKDQYNLDPNKTLNLVTKTQDIITFAHNKDVLIVDLNEMNFLVNKNLDEVYAIDVDSWQTKSFPATAIMDSIRDPKVINNAFTKESDWFSFAVISFNMFIGIHPYKGNYKPIRSWMDKMKQGISVFHPQVTIPKVCLPLNTIPEVYLKWFKAVLEDGKRLPPPTSLIVTHTIIPIKTNKIIGSNIFNIVKVLDNNHNINGIIWGRNRVLLSDNKVTIGSTSHDIAYDQVISLDNGTIISAKLIGNNIELTNLIKETVMDFKIEASSIMKYDNRFYIKTDNGINEIEFIEIGCNLFASSKCVANVLKKSSKVFNGTVIQNILGAMYVSIFPLAGLHYQIRIAELDKQKIIDAKYEKNILMVVANDGKKYNKYIFKISNDYMKYEFRKVEDINYSGINFTVLDNGIVVNMTEDEKLELFNRDIGKSGVKEIEDPILDGDMKLFSSGNQTMFFKDKEVYTINIK